MLRQDMLTIIVKEITILEEVKRLERGGTITAASGERAVISLETPS